MKNQIVDLEEGVDLLEPDHGKVSTELLKRVPEDQRAGLVTSMAGTHNEQVMRVFREHIESKYRTALAGQYNKELPDPTSHILFIEGYKEALRDLYKIIPRPHGD